jgi:predicted PurR-regulated permease PerM
MKHFIKDILIIFISLLIFFIILYNIFFYNKEGFSLKDIDNVVDNVKNVTAVVGTIPNEINNVNKKLTEQVTQQVGNIDKKLTDQVTQQTGSIDKKLTEQVDNIDKKLIQQVNNMGDEIIKKTEKMGKEIEKNTINILTNKLGSIFTQIGDIFNKGIVDPILAVFKGFGNIFVQIFNILKEIGNKIVSLPNCIFTYAIKESLNTLDYFYDRIMPNFLRNIFSFIYRYTFRYLFEFVGYITGYSDNVQKCYGFNVSSEVDKMNSSINNIGETFNNDFGRLDFSKIKI